MDEEDNLRAMVEQAYEAMRLMGEQLAHARFMAAGWRRLARACAAALSDLGTLPDPLDEIREILGEDTGRIEAVRFGDGMHIEDRPRPSSDEELVEDVRRVKERADRLLFEHAELQDQRDQATAEALASSAGQLVPIAVAAARAANANVRSADEEGDAIEELYQLVYDLDLSWLEGGSDG